MNLRQIPNSVIAQVENMARKGCTYKQIKEATGVSHGTIAKVKQGKIKLNRKVQETVTPQEYAEIKKTLLSKEKEIAELNKKIKELEIYKQEHLQRLKEKQRMDKVVRELKINVRK